jgi:hypothetical protein
MPGRGPTTFQKRQKEQARKEKREEKLARRLQKKASGGNDVVDDDAQLDDLGIDRSPVNVEDVGPLGQGSSSND